MNDFSFPLLYLVGASPQVIRHTVDFMLLFLDGKPLLGPVFFIARQVEHIFVDVYVIGAGNLLSV